MFEIIKNLIFQFYLVLVVPLLYRTFWKDAFFHPSKKYKKYVFSFFNSITVMLCIMFSIPVLEGHYFDLRVIPLVFTILYTDFIPSFIVMIILLLTRFFVGGDGFIVAIFITLFTFSLTYLLKNRFMVSPLIKKLQIATGLVLMYSLLKVFITNFLLQERVEQVISIFFILTYIVIVAVSIYIIIFSIESIVEKEKQTLNKIKNEKKQVVSQLAASVAHEVFSPLTTIKGFVQHSYKSLKQSNPKEAFYLEMALKETDRAETIIKDYLTLANPIIDLEETINIKHEIDHIKDEINNYASENQIVIEYSVAKNLLIKGNHEKFRLTVKKILHNAIEASPAFSVVECHAYQVKNEVIIHINDRGIGMTPDEIELLGLPFYTLKEKGTGLSLMICYKIIDLMSGEITITSQKDEGTKVTITFPAQ
ncbi:HAMP domain-containing histidine kinase [Alkalihalobacillus sp. MEB130]|uniref:ATP-binding protein n=1 Tax=Alkalihalobacillus sp. MEB130 TaxID=2976704 RepID=UPI0028DE52FD|nr:ATP-binding protein [Alkalihalobacillus sp. MEB130]MDT8858858.1 HAMP domain-containing histidine kinase [Alkalihalobacillus sp. MEB130]